MDFCVNCGKKELFKDHLCRQCYLKYHPQLHVQRDVIMYVCRTCGNYQYEHRWIPVTTLEGALKKTLLRHINLKKANVEFTIPQHDPRHDKKVAADVLITDQGDDEYALHATIRYLICPACERKNTPYFEATIQLRSTSKPFFDFVQAEFLRLHIHVAATKDVKGGVDYYIDNNSAGRRFLKSLRQRYSGIAKTSSRHFTQDKQTSKELHRVTFYFNHFPHQKGDTFTYRRHDYEVISAGKEITALDKETGEKKTFTLEELSKGKVF